MSKLSDRTTIRHDLKEFRNDYIIGLKKKIKLELKTMYVVTLKEFLTMSIVN